MDIEFKNVKELYNRVKPALTTKMRLILKKGIKTNKKEIFDYLVETKWKQAVDLTLSDIVSDILNLDDDAFINGKVK